jgi:hypothetical protein
MITDIRSQNRRQISVSTELRFGYLCDGGGTRRRPGRACRAGAAGAECCRRAACPGPARAGSPSSWAAGWRPGSPASCSPRPRMLSAGHIAQLAGQCWRRANYYGPDSSLSPICGCCPRDILIRLSHDPYEYKHTFGSGHVLHARMAVADVIANEGVEHDGWHVVCPAARHAVRDAAGGRHRCRARAVHAHILEIAMVAALRRTPHATRCEPTAPRHTTGRSGAPSHAAHARCAAAAAHRMT